ncbi:hypothetical protein CVT26_003131 [Gymnopilus dilepis]|uniref:Uncharacterized protein n=1 Tax=Gymnopilus dilepis TaxID=231916 RepID=A0A409Y4R8_9AGAR|nr:hypothetical protein CVT26_003131 [Gymnopilus dilepis]
MAQNVMTGKVPEDGCWSQTTATSTCESQASLAPVYGLRCETYGTLVQTPSATKILGPRMMRKRTPTYFATRRTRHSRRSTDITPWTSARKIASKPHSASPRCTSSGESQHGCIPRESRHGSLDDFQLLTIGVEYLRRQDDCCQMPDNYCYLKSAYRQTIVGFPSPLVVPSS